MLCRMGNKEMEKIVGRVIVVIGIVSLVFGIVFSTKLDESQHNLMMLSGMFSGMGSGLLGVAIIFTIRDKMMSPEKKREKEIEKNDERNIALMNRTLAVVTVSLVMTLCVLAFVLVGMNYVVPSLMMMGAIYLQLPVFFIGYKILNKRM